MKARGYAATHRQRALHARKPWPGQTGPGKQTGNDRAPLTDATWPRSNRGQVASSAGKRFVGGCFRLPWHCCRGSAGFAHTRAHVTSPGPQAGVPPCLHRAMGLARSALRRRISSVGQSARFVIEMSRVRIPHPARALSHRNPVRLGLIALEGAGTGRQGFVWCPETELNHRHADFQSAALPTELSGHRVGSPAMRVRVAAFLDECARACPEASREKSCRAGRSRAERALRRIGGFDPSPPASPGMRVGAGQPAAEIDIGAAARTERGGIADRSACRRSGSGHLKPPSNIAASGGRSRLRCSSKLPSGVQPARLVSAASPRRPRAAAARSWRGRAWRIGAKSIDDLPAQARAAAAGAAVRGPRRCWP